MLPLAISLIRLLFGQGCAFLSSIFSKTEAVLCHYSCSSSLEYRVSLQLASVKLQPPWVCQS